MGQISDFLDDDDKRREAAGAGSAAEQIRQESPNGLLTGRQAGLAGLSGVADAGFGLLGGKMAQRLGIGDVETMLAGAGRAAAKPAAQPVAKGLPRQMAQGALSEGVLEELPQSVSEQALQNIALDRPWQEDVDSAAVLGTLSGGVMGAGASGLHGLRSRPAGAEPLKPSQRMGLDANAGQLSAAAVVAVDSGASPAALAAAAQQGAQHGAQPDAQQGALQESAEAQQAALAAGQAQGPREAAALERVAALDEQLAAARQSLAALDAQAAAPDGAQDEPQQAARAQLAQQVQQLQAERESLTQDWPRMQAGKALSFGTESGAQLAGHWALAEADQLVTSHDEGLRQNPAYPQQLQPRERSRAASEAQIARMAQRLQPERLAHSADAATGAPIVGADGLVESGNARSIAIKRVYAGPGPQAAAYKDFLQAHAAEFGLTPEQVAGMQKPVLVRVRDTPVNRAEFARQANAPTVAMMSPAEQARADAARMDSMDGLEPDESGDFSGAASRGFVRRFMARLPVSEQAAMVDADGRLSSAGYARVRNAVLAKAWGAGEGGSDALARMTESLDDNTRSISRALMMAAPETARMREAIAAGARYDADIAGDVAAAAQEISRLREAGQSVQQALAQTDAFGDKHTPEARALMQFMADNARRPKRIAQLIQAYWQALDAAGDPHQQGMFGGQAAPTKQALLQAAMRQVQDAPAQSAAQEREAQEREAQDRAQAAWNALPQEGRHQLALAAGVQGVVARNAARHADWSGLPAAMQQRLAQAVGAASAAPGRDNAAHKSTHEAAHKSAHETAHKSTHESGVPRGLAARETADSRQLEGIINRNIERSGQEAAFKALAVGADQLPDALRGALAAFERATGARAVVFRNLTPHVADFNGVTVRDGTLFINETSQSPITGVAAHEWLHNLRRTHPALYHELAAEVARQGDAQGFARQWGYAPGEAQEELTAAAVGDAMTDPQFLARLAEKDGGLFARVAKSFLAFLDTLTARWRSQGSNAYLRDVQAFRDKLAAVLQAYEQQAGQAGGVGQAGLPQAMFQRVWHGTPHKGIEKTGFKLNKIGTGEGLQVYGHGIYFASRREVAEFYRGMRQGQVRLDGRLMTDGHHRGAASTGDPEVDALLLDAQGDVDKAIAWARDFGQDAQAAKLERLRGRVQRGEPGQLYAAEIPEDDDLLDWDKPLDAQPAKVRRALLELAGSLPADGRAAFRQAMARRATGQDVYAFLAQRAAGADASAEGAQQGQRAASELLLAHGIPGLRYLDGDSRNAGEGSHNYVIWDEGLLTPDAAQIAPQYSRKQATKAAYERRIDELFAGGQPALDGVRVLDRSDVLSLLGMGEGPVRLAEGKVIAGIDNHPRMTAKVWKQIPEWIENPAAVFESDTAEGLVFLAPETLGDAPVSIIVRPDGAQKGALQAHLLLNAYDRSARTPFMRWIHEGLLKYADTKKFPSLFQRASGRQLPGTALRNRPGTERILTENNLAAWRKAQAAKAGDAPAFSLPESRASRQVKREASALKVQQAQRLVKALSRGWANAPEVVIASSVRDEALPETARRAIAKQESRGAGGRVEGFYWQGKVYLVAGNLPSMHDVARVYMHETLGHYGLRGVYGEKLNSILNRTGMAMRGEVIERARQYGFHGLGAAAKTASDAQVWDSMTDKQKLDSAEEALAYLAQTGGKVGDEKSLGLLRELVAAIRSWLRAHVPVFANLRYSDDEIMREFILPARRWVKNGSGQADDAGDVMFQLAWHGTPYRGIEKTGFKLNKIGTGEGAQAYGWGIYFASQRHVAEEYRRNLTRDTPQARYEMLGKHKDMLDRQIRQGGSYLRYDEQGRVIAQGLALKDGADMKGVVIQPYSKWKLAKLKKQAAELEAQMNELRTLLGPGGSIAGGQLYQTDVPEDKDLLIWDSPWNKQPLKVRRAVVNFLRQVSNGPVRPTQSDIPRIHAADALKHRIQNRKRSDALTGKDLYTAFRDIFGGPKAASEALRAAGVPGLRYLDGMSRAGGEGTYNYVIWDEALLTPEAAQIAPQYSRKRTDGFYSALQEAVENAPMKMGDAQAWKQYLTGQINKGAVKEDEVFWSGVREWLDAQAGKVSRQGVQDWLAGNHVRIEPVWEGLKYTVQDLDGDKVRFDSLQDAQAFYEELVQRAHDMVQVHEDDDEIIIEDTEDGTQETLTRDEDGVWTGDMSYEAFDTREAALEYAQSLADAWRETWQERLPQGPQRSGNRKYHEYSFADKGANYRELLLTAQVPDSHLVRQQLGVQQHAQQRAALERQQKDVQDRLQSARRLLQQAEQWQQQTGWGDDERFAYFTGRDGTRFFATRPEAEQYARQAAGITSHEALLSKVRENTINALREYVAWQQKDSEEEAARLERVLAGLPAPGPMTGMLYGSSHWDTTDVIAHTRLTDFENGQTLFVEELQSDWAQDVRKGEVSAHAPFVDSTGKWLDLLLKKVLLQAAEGGYARVAFIGGQQSADRYRLDRQISRIEYDNGRLMAYRKDGGGPIRYDVQPGQLKGVIGEEAAQKLLDAPVKDGVQVIEGDDLKMGGEGMRAFYDNVVPKALGKLLKKADKSVQLQMREQPETGQKQLSFEMTPALREKLDEGLPLFSRKQATKAAYDKRIDALFAGAKPALQGVRVLDRSDVLGLLGMSDGPVHLVESKVEQGRFNHGLTASDWKKVPEWLDRPAAVFDSETTPGRLVFIAPERVRGAPVRMVIDPREQDKGVNLLINAYDAERNPFARWEREGLLRYFDRQQAQKAAPATGSFQPRLTGLPGERGRGKILTEKHLAGWRKLHTGQAQPDAWDFGGRSVQQLQRDYAQLPGTDAGHVIDVDMVRELSPQYRADRSQAARIHRAASDLSKELFAQALARPVAQGRDPVAVFTAGGGGSGKSTAIRHLMGEGRADVTLDGTLSKLERARQQVQAALASDRSVQIRYVYRSPAKAAQGAIERAIASGRPVPVDVLAQAHANAPRVVKALAQEYAGHEKVRVLAIYNDGDSLADARLMRVEEIPDVDEQDARRQFERAVDAAWRRFHPLYPSLHETDSREGLRDARGEGAAGRAREIQRQPVPASSQGRRAQQDSDALGAGGFSAKLYEAFTGHAPPGDEAARFSRRAPEPLEPRPNEAARLKESALEQLDRVFSHPGTVSWWHKTVGTMRNLAERQPLFKPVYEAAQQFIDDVSHFANDAADFAPRLLPRLESWRDLGKRAVSAADSQAVAAPLFEGTLSYTRGKDGSLVKTDNVDAAGVVFTDAELKGRFGLTPAQIELYRQARAAIDRSIDTTARADILRLAGRDFAHLRQAVMDAPDLRAAAVQVVEAMQEVMQGDAKRRDAMRKAIEAAQERVQTAQALMQRGYAPLTRFGRYTLDVVDAQGQRQYFGLYESRREANVAAIHMRSQYPGAQVTQGTLSDDAYKLFAGITPESLELFGDLLAAPGQGKDKGQEQAFQAWLQLARNNRSAIKRLIHRKGVAGYSQDAGRVLASFIYANARQTAGALNAGRMDRAIAAIPKEQGQLRDVAMALRDYTQNPREEGQAIRGMLFAQYLGGSLASAAVNMTQPFAVTLPWLSQFGGMRQAAAQMTRALADMTRPGHRYEADLARDMKKAEEDGVVSPQEIHQLMAQARGAGALRSGDGTRRGDALAAAANAWERLKVAWGQPFALAEQFNRRSTYIAAWRLARQQGMADADAFARRAVLETQFVYTKANKARWGRGAVGGALFTFKTYSVSYLELMHRMWTQGGKPGKQGVAWMLAMLLLMGGAGGLPFMEDAEDLIDGLAQLAGYNTSVKQWRRQALQDIVGDGLAEFIESGVSGLPGAPIDISGRLGMGNLLPGTGLLLTKQNRERDLLDVAGPAGDLLARGFTAGRKLLTGDVGGAAMDLAPTAARNLAKGADMLATGSYRDAKGYKVLDTTALEALAKAAGFQPRSVAQVQEGNSFLMRSKSFYQHTSAEIKAQWARALFEKDEAALQRVRQRVADWNRRNPEQPITVRMPDIWRRVREMGKERSQRIADSAPRALRQQMRQALAQEG